MHDERFPTALTSGRAVDPVVKGETRGSRPPPIDFYFVSYHSQSERNRYQTVTLDRQSIAFQEKRVRPVIQSPSVGRLTLGQVVLVVLRSECFLL